jgi:hypothetical protein
VDKNEKVHIVYSGVSGYTGWGTAIWSIYYVTNRSGLWEEIELSPAYSHGSTSVGVDSNNKVHICDIENQTSLVYITNAVEQNK